MKNDKIVAIAMSYVGQTEIKGNQGFKDKAFEKKMVAVGFNKGDAWCAYFAELVWKEGGQESKTFSASAWITAMKFQAAGYEWSGVPVPGALVVYRSFKNGKPLATGHIGIVTEVTADGFKSVEGNTSASGSREGTLVGLREHSFRWSENNGLRLMGFVYPK